MQDFCLGFEEWINLEELKKDAEVYLKFNRYGASLSFSRQHVMYEYFKYMYKTLYRKDIAELNMMRILEDEIRKDIK